MKRIGVAILAVIAPLCFGASEIIRPGELWPDDRGQHIQAHGGGIIHLDNVYYWFGEERGQGLDTSKRYVSCYSSLDLVHWKFRNRVIQLSDPENFGPTWVLERPQGVPQPSHREVRHVHAH